MKTTAFAAVLLLTAGCVSTHPIRPRVASSNMDFANAPVVEVRLSSYHFTPNVVRLEAGRPYALKLVNAASVGHTFTAPDFFAAAQVAPGAAPLVEKGQIELPRGGTVVIRLVPTAGEYKVVCTELGHALLGMTGRVVVSS
jgi:plastocyanin